MEMKSDLCQNTNDEEGNPMKHLNQVTLPILELMMLRRVGFCSP